MTQENIDVKKSAGKSRRPLVVTIIGVLILVAVIVITVIISKRNVSAFLTQNIRYILSIEIIALAVFMIEMLARLITARPSHTDMIDHSSSWRLIVRIIGYTIGVLSVISILASNTTLGISVGAIAGVVIAFATQNIASSVLAAILIVSTRMIRVGEEIIIGTTVGTVSDISLIHTVLSVGEDVVFVPNSLIVANQVRRKKRNNSKLNVNEW